MVSAKVGANPLAMKISLLTAFVLSLSAVACSASVDSEAVSSEDDLTKDGGAKGVGDASGDAKADARVDAASNDSGSSANEFVDDRDDATYALVTFGKQKWFARNLNFRTSGSFCYDDDDANCDANGRLYTFAAAQKACPTGSHLGSDDDWKDLEASLGMSDSDLDEEGYSTPRGTDEGTTLKKKNGFGAKMAGFRGGAAYDALGDRTYFWTSTTRGSDVWRRRIAAAESTVFRFTNPPADFAISVRCVVD